MRSPGRQTPSSRAGPCWYHCWPEAALGAPSALRLGVPVAGLHTWGTPGRALRGHSSRGQKEQARPAGGGGVQAREERHERRKTAVKEWGVGIAPLITLITPHYYSDSSLTHSPVTPQSPHTPPGTHRISPQPHPPLLTHPHPVLDGFGSTPPVQNSQRSLPPGGRGHREVGWPRQQRERAGSTMRTPDPQTFTPATAPPSLPNHQPLRQQPYLSHLPHPRLLCASPPTPASPHSPTPGRGSVRCYSSHPCWLLDRGESEHRSPEDESDGWWQRVKQKETMKIMSRQRHWAENFRTT